MITARPHRPSAQAAVITTFLFLLATSAWAQDSVLTGQAAPTYPYATPQTSRPCTCYFPQGYCPFPRGNCVAVRPTPQSPFGSSQFDTTPPTYLAPASQAR